MASGKPENQERDARSAVADDNTTSLFDAAPGAAKGTRVQLTSYKATPQVIGGAQSEVAGGALRATSSSHSLGSSSNATSMDDSNDESSTVTNVDRGDGTIDESNSGYPPADEAAIPTTMVENMNWIECTKCGKWRLLEKEVNLDDLPEDWECSMNPDKNANNCSAPEMDWQGQIEIRYGYTKEEKAKNKKGGSRKKPRWEQQKKGTAPGSASKVSAKKRTRVENSTSKDPAKKTVKRGKPGSTGAASTTKRSSQSNTDSNRLNKQSCPPVSSGAPLPEVSGFGFVQNLPPKMDTQTYALGEGASNLVYQTGDINSKSLTPRELQQNMQRESHHRFAASSLYNPQPGQAVMQHRMPEPQYNRKGNQMPISDNLLSDTLGEYRFEKDMPSHHTVQGGSQSLRNTAQTWFKDNDTSALTDSAIRARLVNGMGKIYNSIREDYLNSSSICYEIFKGSPYQKVIERHPNMKGCLDAFGNWLTSFRLKQIIGANTLSSNSSSALPGVGANTDDSEQSLSWLAECWFSAADVVKEIEIWLRTQDDAAFDGLSMNTFLALRTLCHPQLQSLCVEATEYRLGQLADEGYLSRTADKPPLFRINTAPSKDNNTEAQGSTASTVQSESESTEPSVSNSQTTSSDSHDLLVSTTSSSVSTSGYSQTVDHDEKESVIGTSHDSSTQVSATGTASVSVSAPTTSGESLDESVQAPSTSQEQASCHPEVSAHDESDAHATTATSGTTTSA